VAEHGDEGRAAEEVACELAGFDGDGGELFDVGVWDESGICEEEDAIAADVFEVWGDEEGGAEDFGDVGEGFDGVEEGAEVGGGECLISTNEGVGLAVLDH